MTRKIPFFLCTLLFHFACDGTSTLDDLDGAEVELSSAALLTANTNTDDKALKTPIGTWIYTGISAASVGTFLEQNDARLTNVQIDPSTLNTFTVTMVRNSGVSAVSGWWWYYNLNAAQVSSSLAQNNARLIDLQKYSTPNGDRFTAVMVANTGIQARSWWWYHDIDGTGLSAALSTNGARLVSLKSRVVNGSSVYTAVMIANAGVDAATWYWYPNVTADTIASKLTEKQARLVDLYRRDSGRFDAVMVVQPSTSWWWYYDVTSLSEVINIMNQKAARPIELQRYNVNGQNRYAVVLIDNATSNNRRTEQAFAANLSGGVYGAIVRNQGAPSSTALNADYAFDPASSLKVVHHAYLMRNEFSILNQPNAFTYWSDPANPTNKNVCPNPAWDVSGNATTTTLFNGDAIMMQNSDNRATHGFELRYGRNVLNNFMAQLGMTKSSFDQSIGCGYSGGKRNLSSIRDLSRVYEAASNGTLFVGNAQAAFFSQLLGGAISSVGWLPDLIRAEAQGLGKSAQVAADFIANTVMRSKGGSYDICTANGCAAYEYVRSSAGRLILPARNSSRAIVGRNILTAWYITNLQIPCTPKGTNESTAQAEARCPAYKAANAALRDGPTEALRAEVRSALTTW